MLNHKNERIRAVVIDNGLNKRIYHELTGKKIKAYRIEEHKYLVEEGDTEYGGLTHGTLCAALLTEFAEASELISISLADGGKPSINHFEPAILWCLNHSVDVICMSMGITSWLDINPMFPLFNRLAKSNIIVVAAASNSGLITYPASLPSVLGVRYRKGDSKGLPLCTELINNSVDGIDIETDLPESLVLQQIRERYQNNFAISNSMVAPFIAAKMVELIRMGYPHSSLSMVKHSLVRYMGVGIKHDKEDNTFASYEELVIGLKDLPFPILGLVYEVERGYEAGRLILSLQKVFCRNGFNTTLFSPVLEDSIEGNVFRFDEGKMEQQLARYTKLILPDLILLHLTDHTLAAMKDGSFIDDIIVCNTECNTETLEAHAESIYQKAVVLFH